jgi:Uma2 family endonuclease
MRALLLDVPQSMLDERSRLGHDRLDEMWDGVLHMVPPPGGPHQQRGTALIVILHALSKQCGLNATYETGLFAVGRDDDYRVPDNVVSRPENRTARGVEGRAELVVEFRSPNDESYEKLPFYARMEVQEVLILDGSAIDLRRLVDGGYVAVDPQPGVSGWVHLACLPLALRSAHDDLIEALWQGTTEFL